MSFLLNLHNNKRNLKPTETIVTYLDGRIFLETAQSVVELDEKTCGYVVDLKPDNIPAKINEHLYVGSQDCCEPSILSKFVITNVLSVGVEAPIKSSGVMYKFVDCLDLPETDLMPILEIGVDFIQSSIQSGKNVLVHCNAGVSRSAAMVIGYLIMIDKYTYTEAYDVLKESRQCIRPNDGFIKQLMDLHCN